MLRSRVIFLVLCFWTFSVQVVALSPALTHRSFKNVSLAKWSDEIGLRSAFDSGDFEYDDMPEEEQAGEQHTGRSLDDPAGGSKADVAIRKDFPETWMFEAISDIGYIATHLNLD